MVLVWLVGLGSRNWANPHADTPLRGLKDLVARHTVGPPARDQTVTFTFIFKVLGPQALTEQDPTHHPQTIRQHGITSQEGPLSWQQHRRTTWPSSRSSASAAAASMPSIA